ncbi:unnamed protein product, partial [Sphenostylis stenocarpa]
NKNDKMEDTLSPFSFAEYIQSHFQPFSFQYATLSQPPSTNYSYLIPKIVQPYE